MAVSLLEVGDRILAYDATSNATAENDVFGGPCILHEIIAFNDDTTYRFLKLYDDLAPVVGTSTPDEIVRLEGDTTTPLNGGRTHVRVNPPDGLKFVNGLSFGTMDAGGTAGTNGATACAVSLIAERVAS